MNKSLLRILLKTLITLTVLILLIWVAVARPVYTPQGTYKPEFTINSDDLKEHVRTLSETLIPRDGRNPQELMEAAEYIRKELSESSQAVSLQSYEVNGQVYANVIAEYGPESEDVIVVGAHYDAYSELPGADDNASGVAGLIELGKLLDKIRLNSRIELIAYSLEEPPYFNTPYMGSAVHARNAREKNKNIKLMISLEMIGYFTDEPDSQTYPISLLNLFYPDRGNFIIVVDQLFSNRAAGIKSAINRHTDLPAYSINSPAFVQGIDFSDHRSYWEQDYPAVMVTGTAFYRNFEYHLPGDTYDRLDYEKMAKVVYGVFKYLQARTTE